MEYKVKYEDNTGCNESIDTYRSEEEAEAAIAEELEQVKEYFRGRDYDYGEFGREDGLATEIWPAVTMTTQAGRGFGNNG